MGIFGIHMSPIYGEGEAEAFERLHSEIDRRDSQQEKRLQGLGDKDWHVELISKFTTADCSTGLMPVPSQARTRLGLSSILFLRVGLPRLSSETMSTGE
jgi:hypothetical protein